MIALFFLNIQTQGLEGRRWWKRTRFACVGSATRFYRRLNEKQRATSIISKRKPRYGSSKSPQVVLQLSSFPLPPYPFEDRSSIEVTFVETDVRHEKKKKKSKRYWEIGLTDPWRSKKSKTKRRKRDKFRDESSFIRFNRRSPLKKREGTRYPCFSTGFPCNYNARDVIRETGAHQSIPLNGALIFISRSSAETSL